MKFNKFINECRENGLLKNLSIYIVSSWVLLQVVALIAEPVGLSKFIVTYLLLALLIGFPLYIYGIWRFQLAADVKRKPVLDEAGDPVPGKFLKSSYQKLYFLSLFIISFIACGISLLIIRKNFINQIELKDIKADDKIAVLKFDNNTGEDKYDIVGKMAVDWIIHGITQNKVGQVISPEIINDYSRILNASIIPSDADTEVTDYLKPSKIIEGEFFLNKNRLLFQCSIMDAVMDKTLISFPAVDCEPDAPLECIEALRERILGYLVTENKRILSLEETPPGFEAYQYLIRAKNLANSTNYQEHLRLLDLAIAADSTFFEPKVYKFMYYYNTQQYEVADSLLNNLISRADVYERQQTLLNLYEGLLEGNYSIAYEYQQKEYNLTPFHLETNASMMTLSLQLVNKPQAVDSIFKAIDMNKIDVQNCFSCTERYKIMGLANIELQKYEETISLLDGFANLKGYAMLKKVLLRALIRAAKYEEAQTLLSNSPLTNEDAWMDIYLFASGEFLIKGNKPLAAKYLSAVIDAGDPVEPVTDLAHQKMMAECLFLKGEYLPAQELLETILRQDASLIHQKALLAITYQKNGNPAKAESLIEALKEMKSEYQYGSVDYALAQYYAAMGDDKNTFNSLLKSIAGGHWYETSSFQNDPFFSGYFKRKEFLPILTFWH